ncbi:MAG TPA: hypothetical protein VF707_05315 [Ardenticatenaceae bacterium]|jgi:hypothetical protein
MFEWQVNEDDKPFASPVEGEDAPARRWRVNWRLLLALVAGCVVIALGLLRWRIAERDAAVRADITRFVTYEERSRLFGLTDNAASLLAAEVPREWRQEYLATFPDPGEGQAVALEVGEIALRDDGALVTVRLDGQAQVRYYRLEENGWRRAPLPQAEWGEEERLLSSPLVPALRFRHRDETFARALDSDLATLTEQVSKWEGWTRPQYIHIQPDEFGAPLLQENASFVRLNSPQLLSYPRAVGGEGAVRLALAQALFRLAGPQPPAEPTEQEPEHEVLPPALAGAARFVEAARHVSAMRWALSPEEQERLRELWRGQLSRERWFSPFLTAPQTRRQIDVQNPSRAEASALLAADYIYETGGPEKLAAIVNGTEGAQTWDRLLQQRLGRFAADLDREVAAYTWGGVAAVRALDEQASSPAVAVPFQTSGGQSHPDLLGEFYAQVPDADEPILVQTAGADIRLSDGTQIPPDCVGFDGPVEVDGDWLDVGTRLRANRITLHEVLPPSEPESALPPAETIAYLLDTTPPQTLLALQPDGSTAPLVQVGDQQISALVRRPGDPARFLLQYQPLGCNWIWLLLYDPTSGVTARWLSPPNLGYVFMEALWPSGADNAQDLLAFIYPRATSGTYYTILHGEGQTLVEPEGELPGNVYPVGVQADSDRIVMMSWGEGRVELLDPASGEMESPIELSSSFITGIDLSADGRYLTYVPAAQPGAAAPASEPLEPALRVLDLTTGEEETFSFGSEVIYNWMGNHLGDKVLMVVGSNGSTGVPMAGSRLLLLDPANPNEQQAVAVLGAGEEIPWAFSCGENRVLYALGRDISPTETEWQVRLWNPADGSTTTLLQADHLLQPLACP